MQRRTSLILTAAFLGALLSFVGCQQNPVAGINTATESQQKQVLGLSKYRSDLPVENKLKLAQGLTLKMQDQSMIAVAAMFPGLEKTNLVEKGDAQNLSSQGEEVWYYSKEADKTFVVKVDNYSLLLIFNGKEITPDDVITARNTINGTGANQTIAEEKVSQEKTTQQK